MVFVDAQNLINGKRAYDPNLDLDMIELKEKLAEDHDLIRAYWFDSYPTEEQIQESQEDDDRDRDVELYADGTCVPLMAVKKAGIADDKQATDTDKEINYLNW